ASSLEERLRATFWVFLANGEHVKRQSSTSRFTLPKVYAPLSINCYSTICCSEEVLRTQSRIVRLRRSGHPGYPKGAFISLLRTLSTFPAIGVSLDCGPFCQRRHSQNFSRP